VPLASSLPPVQKAPPKSLEKLVYKAIISRSIRSKLLISRLSLPEISGAVRTF
jgi:hypothetical protein